MSAELVRTRRTFGARLWALGLVVVVLQCLGWAVAGDPTARSWEQLLAWQVVYATGLAGSVSALVGALAERREAAARLGGTMWRSAPATAVRTARLGVLAAQLACLSSVLVAPMLVVGAAMGLPDPPLGRMAALAVVLWIGALPWLALGSLVGARFGVYAAVGLALIGHVGGTIRAEAATWWAEPWGWGVRAALPLLRTHANGVPAGPDEAVRHLPVLPTLAMCLALALVLGLAAVAVPPAKVRALPRSGAGGHATVAGPEAGVPLAASAAGPGTGGGSAVVRGRRHVGVAIAGCLRGRGTWALVLATFALITGTRLLWRPAYVHGLTALLVVPGLTCLLACLVERTHAPALRSVFLRVHPARWAAAQGGLLVAMMLPLVVWGALLSGARAGALLVVGACLALALLALDLWLATRFGPGAAIGVTLVGWVWSVVVGGSSLAEGPLLWLFGPWAYAYSATTGDRLLLAAGLSLAVVPPAAYAWVRALRRAAAGG